MSTVSEVDHGVIYTGNLGVFRACNVLGQIARAFDRHKRVTDAMKDHGGNANRGQNVPHIVFVVRRL